LMLPGQKSPATLVDPADVEKARLRLAKAILTIANEDSRDVTALKRAALQRMALDYRRRSSGVASLSC
jgi:hypothetical protein